MILRHVKRSIAPTVEGGESLVLFCAGQNTAGSLTSEEASTNGMCSGESHWDSETTQKESI